MGRKAKPKKEAGAEESASSYCDCPEPCSECIENKNCGICDKPIDAEGIQREDAVLSTLKFELNKIAEQREADKRIREEMM